jgi:hypothetical protein
MSEDVEIARQWVAKARNDLLSADSSTDAPYTTPGVTTSKLSKRQENHR